MEYPEDLFLLEQQRHSRSLQELHSAVNLEHRSNIPTTRTSGASSRQFPRARVEEEEADELMPRPKHQLPREHVKVEVTEAPQVILQTVTMILTAMMNMVVTAGQDGPSLIWVKRYRHSDPYEKEW